MQHTSSYRYIYSYLPEKDSSSVALQQLPHLDCHGRREDEDDDEEEEDEEDDDEDDDSDSDSDSEDDDPSDS